MDDYISRKDAITKIREEGVYGSGYSNEEREDNVVDMLASIHAADVRPVVLCRECVHWERYDNTAGCGYCHKVKFEYGADGYVFNPVREPDFYCADGRKADVRSFNRAFERVRET